jgi:hypothetical protein
MRFLLEARCCGLGSRHRKPEATIFRGFVFLAFGLDFCAFSSAALRTCTLALRRSSARALGRSQVLVLARCVTPRRVPDPLCEEVHGGQVGVEFHTHDGPLAVHNARPRVHWVSSASRGDGLLSLAVSFLQGDLNELACGHGARGRDILSSRVHLLQRGNPRAESYQGSCKRIIAKGIDSSSIATLSGPFLQVAPIESVAA